jgi:nucleotide-binding universal stress UspA family protein
MSLFKKILVPLDYSPGSSLAIRFAADLSARYQASVTLVNVYQPVDAALPEGIAFTQTQLQQLHTGLEKQLVAAKVEAESLGALSVDTKLLEGVVVSEIVDYVRKQGHDLIVMGSHGRTGLKHVIMGSVAEKVVRLAPCPVLTVRLPDQG